MAMGAPTTISADTARGFVHGMEYFGTFLRALFSLFQVMTGESWSEAIARPLMFVYSNAALVSVFFVLFLLLFQVVLINVVIAVLLDKFVADEKTDEEDKAHRKMSLSARDLGIGGLDLGQEGGLAGESGGESVPRRVPTSASPPSSSHAPGSPGSSRREPAVAAAELRWPRSQVEGAGGGRGQGESHHRGARCIARGLGSTEAAYQVGTLNHALNVCV